MHKELGPKQIDVLVGSPAVNDEFSKKIRELDRRLQANGMYYKDWESMNDRQHSVFSHDMFLDGECATSVKDYVMGAVDSCWCPDVVEDLHHHSPVLMREIEKQQEMLPDIKVKIGEGLGNLNQFIDLVLEGVLQEKKLKGPYNTGNMAEGVFVLGALASARNYPRSVSAKEIRDERDMIAKGNLPSNSWQSSQGVTIGGTPIELYGSIALEIPDFYALFPPSFDAKDPNTLKAIANIKSKNNTTVADAAFKAAKGDAASQAQVQEFLDELEVKLEQSFRSMADYFNIRKVAGFKRIVDLAEKNNTNKLEVEAGGTGQALATTADIFLKDKSTGDVLGTASVKKDNPQIFQSGKPGSEIEVRQGQLTGGGILRVLNRLVPGKDSFSRHQKVARAFAFFDKYNVPTKNSTPQELEGFKAAWNNATEVLNDVMKERFDSNQEQYKMEIMAALALMIVKNTESLNMDYIEVGKKPAAVLPKDFPKYADHFDLNVKEPIPQGNIEILKSEVNQPTIVVTKQYPLPETLEAFEKDDRLRYTLDTSLKTVRDDMLEDPENIPRVLGTGAGIEALVGPKIANQPIAYQNEKGQDKTVPLNKFLTDMPRDMDDEAEYDKKRALVLDNLKKIMEVNFGLTKDKEGLPSAAAKERLYSAIRSKLNAMLPEAGANTKGSQVAAVRAKLRGTESRTYVQRGNALKAIGKYSRYLDEIRAEASPALAAAIEAVWSASSELLAKEKEDVEKLKPVFGGTKAKTGYRQTFGNKTGGPGFATDSSPGGVD